ncbi:MAG: M23 family metallopeptidase [Fibrobacter sp.]|nr:M23 family metallopeptidase [Fibrobacter sp.]
MPTEFQEYKSKRKKINSQHKFPLLRLIFVATVAFFAYWFGIIQKIVDVLPLPGASEPEVVDDWENKCNYFKGKPFLLKNGMAQCSWMLNDSSFVQSLPVPFLRYVASLRKSRTSKLHWVASVEDFSEPSLVLHEDEELGEFLYVKTKDSSKVWVSKKTGCLYPGPCPQEPMDLSALAITDGFDFDGQEELLSADVFSGVGEAPIRSILPGIVLASGRDSTGFFVELDHGNNVTSKTSGMGSLIDSLSVGDTVVTSDAIGRLLPKDSSSFYLSVRRNGLFVRWKDFYESSHPITQKEIAAFEKNLGF